MRFQKFMIVPAFLLLGFAPAPFPRPASTDRDLRRIQGEWTYPTTIAYGQLENGKFKWLEKPGDDGKVIIRGNRITHHGFPSLSGIIRLDASKSPRTIDLLTDDAD